MGGLARKATVIEQNNNQNNLYVVDAGNLFFSKELLEDGISREVALINAGIILDSFNEMGCTAFSPGSKDFAAGKEFVLSSEKKALFPFISCNIFDSSRNLLFDPYVIVEEDNLKIAFIGLSSIFESDGILVEDPITSLNAVLNEVVPKSDIRILLFSSNDVDMKMLNASNPDLTMVIRSRNKQRSSDGGKGIPTYTLGDKGKILYKFDLEINNIESDFTDIAWCDRTIKDSNNRLDKMKKGDMLADLEQLFKDNPSALKRVFLYRSRIDEANQKLDDAINKITLDKIELGRDVESKINILNIVDKGKLEIKKIAGPLLDDKGRLPGDPHHGHNH